LTWISGALAAAALAALVNIVDSHIISKRVPSLWAFLVPAGVLHVGFAIILLAAYPLPGGVDAFTWFTAVASALVRTLAVVLMLYTMRTEEVSRIIPVTSTYPVFVAIMAVPLLGETLNYLQWLAVFITVAGAVLISIRGRTLGQGAQLRKSFTLLLISSFLFAVANIASKYALDYISFWNMYSITGISLGVGFGIASLRRGVLAQWAGIKDRARVLSLIGFNEVLALGGATLSFWAMQRGPISLVSTILATRPFFVFIYALVLGLFLPAVLGERLTRGTAVVKIVSIGLIVGGVAIINLAGGPEG
jgi:drug/metabolite transporter (DMT)-like permease